MGFISETLYNLSQALRTLAVAMRTGGSGPVEAELTFVGMVGMKDPARPEAANAVERFRDAGVTTVMITTGLYLTKVHLTGKYYCLVTASSLMAQ